MAKEICISSTPHETRLAILEDDQLAEIYYERENEYTLAGSIYNGRVTRVLPGMQSAFVDLGLERDAFLYVTDFIELEDQEETDELEKAAVSGGDHAPREIKHPQTGDRNGVRNGERFARPASKGEPRQDSRHERRPAAQTPPISATPEPPANAGQTASPQEPEEGVRAAGEAGDAAVAAVGRARQPGSPGQFERTPRLPKNNLQNPNSPESIQAPEVPVAPPAPREQQTPPAFVLPGESLSKYGGRPPKKARGPRRGRLPRARPDSSQAFHAG